MQRVIRNSGYLFTGSTLSAALSMIQGILAARLLGIESFGVLGIITVFVSVINRLTSFRMAELVVNYVGEFSEKGEKDRAAAAFKTAALFETGSSVLAFLLILVLAPIAATYLAQDPSTVGLFMLYGMIVPAHMLAESSTGLLQYLNQFKLLAGIQVAQSVITLLLIVGAFATGGGLLAVLVAYLVGKVAWSLGITGAALTHAHRAWGSGWWRAPFSLIHIRRKEMLRFGVSTNLTGTLTLLSRDSEILWLGALASPIAAGYYKVSLAILNILLIPVQPLITTTYRELAREIGARAWDNVRYLLRSGSMISVAYSIPAALFLGVFGPWVISLWGAEFLPQSYGVMGILLVGVTFVNVFYWNRTTLLPLGLPEYPTKVILVAAIAKVVAILILVPRYGAFGMAATLSGFFLFTGAVLVWKTVRVLRQRADAAPLPAAG
ncbi:MAG: oligosaccharide flippase family protein [Chloroflexi bacterium]|nr:oligosaccharide flippase family protein [Chloroflexota bacterium]